MSYFNMVCDSCGREVHGCNIVNGMKFCAKCYQETFGETDKDKQIAELQKQLERHNKYFNSFSCDNFDEFADFISTFMLTPHEEQTLIKDLKKQLEEKEKVISNLNGLVRERDKQIKNLKTNKKRVIEHKNKNKISFTIEKLEKVKEIIANHTQELWTCENDDIDLVLYEEIDNQIKELKGGK